jgi:4-diphosphocytidyl-2-C-methyl-D-erythritol kinase
MIARPTLGGWSVLAPAKLNLFLEVLGRRADGYHEVESLMVTVDLFDALEFADDPSGRVGLECDDPSLPTDSNNLVVRTADRLKALTGCDRGARITLRKAIPAQAGLAGGSSDASATIEGLDKLWDLGLSSEDKDALAASIGSDVAFFGHGPCAVCRGRGEIVEPQPLPVSLHFVLITPPVGVSTAEVYRNLTPPDRPRPIVGILQALGAGDIPALGRSLFNRLQPVAESLQPSRGAVRDALAGLGPSLDGSLMSGSGSAYFGLARDRDAANFAASRLTTAGLGRVQVVTCGP